MSHRVARKLSLASIFLVSASLAVFLFARSAMAAGAETQITADSSIQYLPLIDGDKIVWLDNRNGSYDVYMRDLLTQTETRITTTGTVAGSPVVSENRIVWTDSRNYRGDGNYDIYMYDLAGRIETQITTSIVFQYDPAISGDKIVWTDYRNGNADIYMYSPTTQIETRITSDVADQYGASIFGDKIVWTDRRNGNEDIYMYDLVTQTETKITVNIANQSNPAISGDKIVWEDSRNSRRDIYMYDLVTNTETPLITDASDQAQPAISGNRVVWMDDRNISGVYDIYMYDLGTQNEIPITTFGGNQYGPSISGDRIVWSSTLSNNQNNVWDIYMYDLNPNISPTAQISHISTVTLGQAATFDGSGSADPDGTIASYAWDFGDGATGSGSAVNHTYAAAGIYQAALTVTDDDGTADTATTEVSVNASPVAVIAPVAAIIIGETVTFDGSGSNDPDGTITGYHWGFGDGAADTGSSATHTYAATGTYQVSLAVTDNDEATGTATVSIVVQAPARAIDDLMTIVEEMNLAQGITNSLDSKLQNASAALTAENADNRDDVINKLQAFINATQAQSGNQLTVEQADQLIAAANRIIAVIQ